MERVIDAESGNGKLRLSTYSTLDSDWIRRFLAELGVRVEVDT
jgi:hypothetical protein